MASLHPPVGAAAAAGGASSTSSSTSRTTSMIGRSRTPTDPTFRPIVVPRSPSLDILAGEPVPAPHSLEIGEAEPVMHPSPREEPSPFSHRIQSYAAANPSKPSLPPAAGAASLLGTSAEEGGLPSLAPPKSSGGTLLGFLRGRGHAPGQATTGSAAPVTATALGASRPSLVTEGKEGKEGKEEEEGGSAATPTTPKVSATGPQRRLLPLSISRRLSGALGHSGSQSPATTDREASTVTVNASAAAPAASASAPGKAFGGMTVITTTDDVHSNALPATPLAGPPPVVEYNEEEEAGVLAEWDRAEDEAARLYIEDYVSKIAKVVLDAFKVSAEMLSAAMLTEARRKRKLEMLLYQTERWLEVARNRHLAGLPQLPMPKLPAFYANSAFPNIDIPDYKGSEATSTSAGDKELASRFRMVPSFSRSYSVEASPSLPNVHATPPKSLAELVSMADEANIANIEHEALPKMNVGLKLRCADEAFRVMVRSVSHLPAFLGLVLHQRMVESAAVSEGHIALLMYDIRDKRRLLAGYVYGNPPTLPTTTTGASVAGASLSALATPTAGSSGGMADGFFGSSSLSDKRRAAMSPAYRSSTASSTRFSYYRQGSVNAPTPSNAGLAGGGNSATFMPSVLPLDLPGLAERSPYRPRILVPTNPDEAYLRRAFERIRDAVRIRTQSASITVLDFVRVWHPSLDTRDRSDKMAVLLTPSPDPNIVHAYLDFKSVLRKRISKLKDEGANAPLVPRGAEATTLPQLGVRKAMTVTDHGAGMVRGGVPGIHASMSVMQYGGGGSPARMESAGSVAFDGEAGSEGDGYGGGVSGVLTGQPDIPVTSMTLMRATMINFGARLRNLGVGSMQVLPRLVPGPSFPINHRVAMEDLTPCVDNLIERHPDLAYLRVKPIIRRRYTVCVLVSIFSSLPGGHHPLGVPIIEMLRSNVADSFYLCSTASTVGIVPFSNKYFEELHNDFEAAAELTRHTDKTAATANAAQVRRRAAGLGDMGGNASQSLMRSSSGASASGSSVGGGPSSSPPTTTLSLRSLPPKTVFGVPDPNPENDDVATATMPAVLGQCDVSITTAMLERIFAGRPKPLCSGIRGRMCFEDFMWFACYQSERMQVTSLEFWMRCLDLDDDGALSPLDLECAYEAKMWQLQELGVKSMSTLRTAMSQVMDLISPTDRTRITKRDIRRAGCGRIVFEILISLKGSAASRNYI